MRACKLAAARQVLLECNAQSRGFPITIVAKTTRIRFNAAFLIVRLKRFTYAAISKRHSTFDRLIFE